MFSTCKQPLKGERSVWEKFESAEYGFRLEFGNGDRERYLVRYSGNVDMNVREEGERSTLFHPIDTVRCLWTIYSGVSRDVFMVSTSGVRGHVKGPEVINQDAFNNAGNEFSVGALGPEDCGECQARRDSDLNDKVQRMV